MMRFVCILLLAAPIHGLAQFKIVKLPFTGTDGENPSVAISRKSPDNIVVASGAGEVLYTNDTGAQWQKSTTPSSVSQDVVVLSDRKGNFYRFQLTGQSSNNSSIVCYESKDMGANWTEQGSMSTEGKVYAGPRVAIHPKSGEFIMAATQFDQYGAVEAEQTSRVVITTTKDGKKWSTPVSVSQPGDCRDDDQTPRGALTAVSTNGLMFLSWSADEAIYLDRSFDKGNMWLSNDIRIHDQTGGWSLAVPGMRANGLPSLMVDTSPSRFNGALYLVWADQRKGEDDTDIWFSRSVNHGDNWSPAMKINDDDAGKHQFMPAMTIDQATGHVYILYYDRRHYDDNQTDVYLAYSVDNGTSFKNVKVSEAPFVVTDNETLGEHISIDAYRGVIVPVWAVSEEGGKAIYTAIIKQDELTKTPSEKK